MDTLLFRFINRDLANPVLDVLLPALTQQGYLLVAPLLAYVLLRGAAMPPDGQRTLLVVALAAVLIPFLAFPLADHLGDRLKLLLARPRPCHALENVRLLIPCPGTFSLPSSHAITSFAFATPLFLLTRRLLPLRWRLYPLLLAGAIALSRPYVGVHYPSDAAAGALIGAAVAAALCLAYQTITGRLRKERRENGV